MKILNKKISVFLIWLIHISGALGLLYYDVIFFAALTPINLYLTALLLMINQKNPRINELIGIGLIFFAGIIVEYLGVNYNLIFGEYEYGENMGPKFFGVPFLIGVNWIIITLTAGGIANTFFKKNKYLTILFGSILMVFIDFFIEPVAPVLDFWEFKGNIVPISNYTGWLFTGLITQSIYYITFKEKEFTFSINLYSAILVFFLLLNLLG
mgnify:FL=1